MAVAQGSKIDLSDLQSYYTSFNNFISSYGGSITQLELPTGGKVQPSVISDLNDKIIEFQEEEYLGTQSDWWVAAASVTVGEQIQAADFTNIDTTVANMASVKCRNTATNSKGNHDECCNTNSNNGNCCNTNSNNGNCCNTNGNHGQTCSYIAFNYIMWAGGAHTIQALAKTPGTIGLLATKCSVSCSINCWARLNQQNNQYWDKCNVICGYTNNSNACGNGNHGQGCGNGNHGQGCGNGKNTNACSNSTQIDITCTQATKTNT